jgi:hypothetical protein
MALAATSCAILHPGVAVLLPLDNAGISRDTVGSTIAAYGVSLPTQPEKFEKPPPTTFSCGFAILTPGPTVNALWHLERIVALIDVAPIKRPLITVS